MGGRVKAVGLALAVVLLLTASDWLPASGEGSTRVLFVPLDTRPITYGYPAAVANRVGLELLRPPATFLDQDNHQPDELYLWIKQHISRARGAILSTDALVYGSLVASRKHNFSSGQLHDRLNQLARLPRANPRIPIYAYTSLMRLPRKGGSDTEPFYYEEFGARIYEYSVLEHRQHLGLLTATEAGRLEQLQKEIPPSYLADYLTRRQTNLAVTKELLQANPFDYLLLYRDDTTPYGLPRLEYEELQPLLGEASTSVTGADEVGLLLLARLVNALRGQQPGVFVDYADPGAQDMVPYYEDEPLEQVVARHIAAAGAREVGAPGEADLVLAVNNAFGQTSEAAGPENNPDRAENYLARFIARIRSYLQQGQPVAVADVAFNNGADNKLIQMLLGSSLYWQLAAYGGWNTASNALGSALAEGLIGGDPENCLAIRLVDDWAYQANVRQAVKKALVEMGMDPYVLDGTGKEQAEQLIQEKLNTFLRGHGVNLQVSGVRLPWNRLFEIDFAVLFSGINPLLNRPPSGNNDYSPYRQEGTLCVHQAGCGRGRLRSGSDQRRSTGIGGRASRSNVPTGSL